MEITVVIADTIAGPADTFVRSLRGDPQPNPNGPGDVQLPLYPNGLDDWVDSVIAESLLRLPTVAASDIVQTKQQEIRAAKRAILDSLRPGRL